MKRLLSSLKGAKPESRFFISLWFRFFAPEAGVPLPVAEIAKMLGVSKNVVMSSLAYMTTEGFFERSHIHLGVRAGRPTSQYFATNKLLAILCDDEHPRFHAGLIEELHYNNHQHLTLSNRLLLCVFLLHANEYGLVENLGFSVIAQMTGMSNDQFNSQLDKLSRLRYLRKLSSGVTSKVIFGSKPSIYLLDITNERFSSAIFRSVTCEQAIGYDYEEMLNSLIARSLGGLTGYRNAQREKDADRKERQLKIYENAKEKFDGLACTGNSERSWMLFAELKRRPVLKYFLYEKILLLAAQKVFSGENRDETWFLQLAAEFRMKLEPRFEKGAVLAKDRGSEAVAEVGDAECRELASQSREDGDSLDFWDLEVFSQILANRIILPVIEALESKIAILEQHFDMPFSSAFVLEDKQTEGVSIKPTRSILGLYPVSQAQVVKRVYVNTGKVHDLDVCNSEP
ncbi:hypothetical protein [Shewanella septentrionalis]|uniref:Uncharacterized protein n=1 Tax=Shewanella septentrionalis TaxID=2952223 RepID=A0A9X3ASB7_9GAMM|nr:hypothetical protein [Shewanella septentrionalis]MCT7944191.1 hypothetical protein [Shewanella septentrionalis]